MRPLLRAATLPVRDVMRGLARALTSPLDLVWILGGTDREELKSLVKRKRPKTDAG